MRHCPRPLREDMIVVPLSEVLPAMESRLKRLWEQIRGDSYQTAQAAGSCREGDVAARDEVVRDRLLRDLTKEFATVVQAIVGCAQVRELWGVAPLAAVAGLGGGVAGVAGVYIYIYKERERERERKEERD